MRVRPSLFGTLLILFLLFSASSCLKYNPPEEKSSPKKSSPDSLLSQRMKDRKLINEHVSQLADDLVAQPVMTPRAGFSGYLAHFNVIRTTTEESPFAVILDGEGYSVADTPSELLGFAELKGSHPYGGTYAFSGSDPKVGSKDRHDNNVRLVMEIPGPKGDGLVAIAFSGGEVITIKAPAETLEDKDIQEILSVYGKSGPE